MDNADRGKALEFSTSTFLFPHQTPLEHLISTAQALVHPRGRGIYATDETPELIESLLSGAEATTHTYTEDEKRNRRKQWRQDAYKSLSSGQPLLSTLLHPV
jgi:fructose-bisphosphate aldolase, class I